MRLANSNVGLGIGLWMSIFLIGDVTAQVVEPLNVWSSRTGLDPQTNPTPENGLISDAESWQVLWSKWLPRKPVPDVDFQNDFVWVGQAVGPNSVQIDKAERNGDDLKVTSRSTLRGGNGFGFVMAQFSRSDIKTVNGNVLPEPLATTPNDSTTDNDMPAKEGVRVEMVGMLKVQGQRAQLLVDGFSYSLQLPKTMMGKANSLTEKRAQVWGDLIVESRRGKVQSLSVQVTRLEGLASATSPGTFEQIVIERSGGFVGLMQRDKISADGKVIVESLKTGRQISQRNLSTDHVREVNQALNAIDWDSLPADDRGSAGRASDNLIYHVEIKINGRLRQFDFDSTSRRVGALKKIVALIDRQ